MNKTFNKINIDEIIRVNQAGEYGAKRIYQGQLAFAKTQHEKNLIREMLDQELEHLDYFEQKMIEKKVRPTAMQPLWHILGYGLGAATSIMGKKAAMLCTKAVEEVIADHYQEQINSLTDEEQSELKAKITQFREEELEHHETAIENEAMQAPFYSFLNFAIKTVCKAAIKISKKI